MWSRDRNAEPLTKAFAVTAVHILIRYWPFLQFLLLEKDSVIYLQWSDYYRSHRTSTARLQCLALFLQQFKSPPPNILGV